MGGGTCTAPLCQQYQDFVDKLRGDDSSSAVTSAVALFDSFLSEVRQITPVAAQGLYATGIPSATEKMKVLSEIERQLFLHFLISELTYLRGHRMMKGTDLWHKLQHDQQICKKKQIEISNSLIRIFNIQGIDSGFYSALTAERGDTLVAYIQMKFTEREFAMMNGLDDLLNNRETGAVRRILDQLLDDYSDTSNGDDFHAHDAWMDLKNRWDAWASKHRERIAAFKELWNTMGGGKDLNSNPQAFKVIDDYYQQLYKQLDQGNLDALWVKVEQNAAAAGN